MKIKVFEAFSGVGAQRMALRNIGIEHEVVGVSEIDKFAIKSYEAIHGETVNFGDISKIDPEELPDFDLFTYSFPCQDLSSAGKQQGMIKGQTRSGLLYECEKIIEMKRPKYLLLENVKNLVSKKFKDAFDEWLLFLESLGYSNYWKVLNAKDYGVPQNRERVFVVSVLNDYNKNYTFPQKKTLETCLKDILEHQVEDKYYLSDEVQSRFKPNEKFKDMIENSVGIIDRKQSVERVGGCFDTDNSTHQAGSVYNKEGLSPVLDTMQGGYRQPCITVVGELECDGWYDVEKRVHDANGLGVCVETRNRAKYVSENCVRNYRIRKLTPKECWRLMGFSDSDFSKAKAAGLSDTQLYKQAGNSIVVPVLEEIFSELFKGVN